MLGKPYLEVQAARIKAIKITLWKGIQIFPWNLTPIFTYQMSCWFRSFLSEVEIWGALQQQPETLCLKFRDVCCKKKCYWQECHRVGSI